MLRFLARFAGTWLVAAALVAAVVDGAKSIAASELVTTPVAEIRTLLAGPGEAAAAPAAPGPLGPAISIVFGAPVVLVAGVAGFLLLAAGRRRRQNLVGREFTA